MAIEETQKQIQNLDTEREKNAVEKLDFYRESISNVEEVNNSYVYWI